MDRVADLQATVTSNLWGKSGCQGDSFLQSEVFLGYLCCIAKHSVDSRYQAIIVILCLLMPHEFSDR